MCMHVYIYIIILYSAKKGLETVLWNNVVSNLAFEIAFWNSIVNNLAVRCRWLLKLKLALPKALNRNLLTDVLNVVPEHH